MHVQSIPVVAGFIVGVGTRPLEIVPTGTPGPGVHRLRAVVTPGVGVTFLVAGFTIAVAATRKCSVTAASP